MKVAFYSAHRFELEPFRLANRFHLHELDFLEVPLNEKSAGLAAKAQAVCAFTNDTLNRETLFSLANVGVKLIALRSAGFNHVDIGAAREFGLRVVRVPAYSPHAVAEHAVAMLLCLNRKIHRAYNRVREGNFNLDGLVGFDLHGKKVGVIGTGKIGSAFARIMLGFGSEVLAYDTVPSEELKAAGVKYVSLSQICESAKVVSLHVPLNRFTHHLLGAELFSRMQPGTILLNTGRGALIDTKALVASLKKGSLGGACLDVYEEEEGIYFADHSDQILQDDQLARLLTFPNVLITAHQGFLTHEALTNIAEITLQNITDFLSGKSLPNEIRGNDEKNN